MDDHESGQRAAAGGERRANDGFSGVDAVERALKLLDAFDDAAPAMSLKDLAARSGLTKSTILRLAVSLERFGYLARDEGGIYRLGPTLWRLGSMYRRNLGLEGVVRPVLAKMVEASGESASFYVPRGGFGVCLYRINAPRMARDHVEEGEVIPLGTGSSGQILRAFSDDPGEGADAIRSAGIHLSLGERDPEIAGIAAPVLAPGESLIGAIVLSGLMTRFTPDRIAEHTLTVREAAREIEARLGFGG